MAEQTFRSPGFFDQEIDLSGRVTAIEGTPAGVVGTSDKGPAFVPVTIGTFADFKQVFGDLDPDTFGPYAVQQWLQNRTAVTYTRVLGAGANATSTDISKTKQYGITKNAGFVVSGAYEVGTHGADNGNRARGCVKFIAATHTVRSQETQGFPVFTDNRSFDVAATANTEDYVRLIRAMLLFPTGTTAYIAPSKIEKVALTQKALIDIGDVAAADSDGNFTLILSSTAASFTNELAQLRTSAGIKLLSASLDPSNANYISKVLNTDPAKFQTEQHLLWADFAVEDELATNASLPVAILSGTLSSVDLAVRGVGGTGTGAGPVYQDVFGRFDSRYTTPKTTKIISQPFGKKEFDLFHFETLDDGAYGNDKVKVSIANLVASSDETNKYGTFDVQVRRFGDTDTKIQIIETFPKLSLDPTSDRYIAAVIGDKKVTYDFDAEIDEEKRLLITGKYANLSKYIRVQMNSAVEDMDIPEEALPFGFRGIPTLKTNDALTSFSASIGAGVSALKFDGRALGTISSQYNGLRLTYSGSDKASVTRASLGIDGLNLSSSIVPPLPYRYKVTRGATAGSTWEGDQGTNERVDNRLYWGVKFERMPETASISTPALNPNISSLANPLIGAYTKFLGIEKLDTLVTGAGADAFNDNKFTLARVGLGPDSDNNDPNAVPASYEEITGSAKAHMLGSVYVRNATLKTAVVAGATQNYLIGSRVSLATLLSSSSVRFNRFSPYAKFSLPFHGGFDGFNALDADAVKGNDRSTSQDGGGKAASTLGIGLCNNLNDATNTNPMGSALTNNSIASFRSAVQINTDPFIVNTNLLAIPGIKDPLISNYAGDKVKEYSKALYIMDIPEYGMKNGTTSTRLYDDDTLNPDVLETAEQFDGRGIDNNYVATYFPSVIIDDATNNRRVKVPSSIAALASYGFNDRVSYPWFAPAGFNRGALEFVKNVNVRLTQSDRDTLYDNRINPIATFPTGGFVIFGQKTLQQAASALDRVNVRRMLLEVKRLINQVSRGLLFEQNNAGTRNRFVAQVTPLLALVQVQAGIESFKVVMDSSNNTALDAEQNRLNGRIIVVPTRAIEFIAIDFIVTNAGVSFE
tara:strand:+ start:5133 stop:8408 length:3276 start_codon:yes stop_codon:yes gene_type:complete